MPLNPTYFVNFISAVCALVGCVLMGPRHGRFDKTDGHPIAMPGHSVPLSALGGLILVFGFFACNGTKRVLKYNFMIMIIDEHFIHDNYAKDYTLIAITLFVQRGA